MNNLKLFGANANDVAADGQMLYRDKSSPIWRKILVQSEAPVAERILSLVSQLEEPVDICNLIFLLLAQELRDQMPP